MRTRNIITTTLAVVAIAAGALAITEVVTGASAPPAAPNYCAVTITNDATTATAHPGNGCSGPYTFKTWSITNGHQTLYRTTPGLTVDLPPCAWQVDLYGNGTFLLGKRGMTDCPPPTTTTTVPPTTTTTTAPGHGPTTTTTTSPAAPPSTPQAPTVVQVGPAGPPPSTPLPETPTGPGPVTQGNA